MGLEFLKQFWAGKSKAWGEGAGRGENALDPWTQ